ncbi:hypothetical protein D3C71_21510 [compost metagenome]
MTEFSTLYRHLRQSLRRPIPFGLFLASLDQPLLQQLAARFDRLYASTEDASELADLTSLAALVRQDEGLPAEADTTDVLVRLCSCVDDARFISLGLIHGRVQDIQASSALLATPTDLCVMALGGCSHLRGAVLH